MAETTCSEESAKRPRVVVVGGGFAGLSAGMALADMAVDVTLIDRRNHHTFQPLLYQVALAVLSPADIAQPIRSIFSKNRNIEVLMDEVEEIDSRPAPRASCAAAQRSSTTTSSWAPARPIPTSARIIGRNGRRA